MANITCNFILALLLGVCIQTSAARMLRQDPATFTSTTGHQPEGFFAISDKAEATAAGSSKGIRYNGGHVVVAGDVYPGAKAASVTGTRAARSGIPADNNMNLGLEVIAATSQGARAVAGSGVTMTAENNATISNDMVLFRPGTSANKGSTAFTDTAAMSAATVGMGNGPAALAWGNEVAAFARSGHNYVTGKMRKEFIDSSS